MPARWAQPEPILTVKVAPDGGRGAEQKDDEVGPTRSAKDVYGEVILGVNDGGHIPW